MKATWARVSYTDSEGTEHIDEWGVRIEVQQSALLECLEGQLVVVERRDGKLATVAVGKRLRVFKPKQATRFASAVALPTALFTVGQVIEESKKP